MSQNLIDWASKHVYSMVAGATITPFVLYGVYFIRRYKNLPPGPYGYPYIGSKFELTSDLKGDFNRLGKKYGDIFCLWMGADKYLIILNSYAAIKEAYISRGTEFAHREPKMFEPLDLQDAIFMSPYDDNQKFGKKIGMQGLRRFVTSKMESVLSDEFHVLDGMITARGNQPINLTNHMENVMTNVISSMLFGKTFPHDHEELLLIKGGCKSHYSGFVAGFMESYFGKTLFSGKHQSLRQMVETFHKYIQQEIEDHHSTIDSDNPRDIIDLYLKDGALEKIGMDKLCNTIMIFVPDQIGTAVVTFAWLLVHFLRYPTYQEQITKEVEEFSSSNQCLDDGMISVNQRKNMAMTEAFIMEVLRVHMPLDVGMMCKVKKPTTLMGYSIPDWAGIIPNYSAVHNDPALFPQPHLFKPERFLKDGKACSTEGYIPFGVGRRMCIGEHYMRNWLFFVFVNCVRKYHITTSNDFITYVDKKEKDGFALELDQLEIIFQQKLQ